MASTAHSSKAIHPLPLKTESLIRPPQPSSASTSPRIASALSLQLRAQANEEDRLMAGKTKQKSRPLARNLPSAATPASSNPHTSLQPSHQISPSTTNSNPSVPLALPPVPPSIRVGSTPRRTESSILSPLVCLDLSLCNCPSLPSLSALYADLTLVDAISPAHALLWAAFVWWCVIIGYSLTYPPMKVCNICVAENWPPWNLWPLTLSMTLVMGFLLNINYYNVAIHYSFKNYVRNNLQQFLNCFTIPFFVASYSAITSQRYFILFIPLNTTLLAAASASTAVVYVALRVVHAHLMRQQESRNQLEKEATAKAHALKKAVEDIDDEWENEDRLKRKKPVKSACTSPEDVVVQVVGGTVTSVGEAQRANTKRVQLLDGHSAHPRVDLLPTASASKNEEAPIRVDGLSQHRRMPIPTKLIVPPPSAGAAATVPPKSAPSISYSASAASASNTAAPATPPPSLAGSRTISTQHTLTSSELSRIAAMAEARLRFLTINLEPSVVHATHGVDAEAERESDEKETKQHSVSRHSPSLRPASPNLSRGYLPRHPRPGSPSLSRSGAQPSTSFNKTESQSRASYLRYEDDVKEFHRLHVAFSSNTSTQLPAKKLLLLRLCIHDADEDISLVDQLLWDPANANATPEIYAANLCAELGFAGDLGKKWIRLISEEIRKQVSGHHAAFAAGNLDAMCSVIELPQAETIFRSVGDAHHWQPQIQLPSNHSSTPSHDHEQEHEEKSASVLQSPTDSEVLSLPMKTFREDESFH